MIHDALTEFLQAVGAKGPAAVGAGSGEWSRVPVPRGLDERADSGNRAPNPRPSLRSIACLPFRSGPSGR